MALKPKPNAVYLHPVDGLFTITHINFALLMISSFNKCITVEFLHTKDECIVSWTYLQDNSIKHLGDNVETARILYEKSVRPEGGQESLLTRFMSQAPSSEFKYADPAEVLERRAELEESDEYAG